MNEKQPAIDLPDFLKNRQVKVVFDAFPKDLVFLSEKKSKIRNVFYMITGIYCPEDKEYLVISDIYRRSKRKGAIYLKKIDSNVLTFKTKTQVSNYIYDFLYKFEEPHEKVTNISFTNTKTITLEAFLTNLNYWYSTIAEYYSEDDYE
jgi:hypothetical protein